MQDAIWGDVREGLRGSVGAGAWKSWIEPLHLTGLERGVATFAVPTAFVGNWVSNHFGEAIRHGFLARGTTVERLAFDVAASDMPCAMKAPAQARAETAAPASRGALDAAFDPRFTFHSYVVGKPNELANAAARRVAAGGPAAFNPLFLYGGVGLGKTHLMHAIAWELRAVQPALKVVYLSAERFMYRFVQALRDKSTMDFKELFRSVDVLMVDDIQFIAGKQSTQEEFFHTFNALVDAGKQIVLSADRAPGDIAGLEERIASRLQSGLIVDLHPTDYELRLGILQTKIEERASGIRVAPGVAEMLARRISSNVRVLEGALNRLFATAELVGRDITPEMAADCLSDMLRSHDRKITMDEIQRRVADRYNLRLADLIGPRRARAIARPRQIAMWLCKRLTTRSLPEIGRQFGGRDHTTVMHGVRRIDELAAADGQFADEVERLRRDLEA